MENAYANCPLREMSHQTRRRLYVDWVRKILQDMYPRSKFVDREPSSRRGEGSDDAGGPGYDFMRDGRKVKVHGTLIASKECSKNIICWEACFRNIMLPLGHRTHAPFDDLYLVLASPDGLMLIKHDLCTGKRSDGKRTEALGWQIAVRGSRSYTSWQDAWHTIRAKFCQKGSCELLGHDSFQDAVLKDLVVQYHNGSSQIVAGKPPLWDMSPAKRALRIQNIARAIDKKLNPGSQFTPHSNQAKVSWVRDKSSVMVKSAKLSLAGNYCNWINIHSNSLDDDVELWLAIYSQLGIHIYMCSSVDDLHLVHQKHGGLALKIRSKGAGDNSIQKALQSVEAELLARGCSRLSMVKWVSLLHLLRFVL